MYSLSMSAARTVEATSILDQSSLIQQMLEDGLALKRSGIVHTEPSADQRHQLIMSDDDENKSSAAGDTAFIRLLNTRQKKALLK